MSGATSISEIQWVYSTERLDRIRQHDADVTYSSMASGFEASVAKLSLHGSDYVMKVWDQSAKPDVGRQYRLLQALTASGVRVSVPIGCGLNADGNAVLLTSHDGEQISKGNTSISAHLAGLMIELHQISQDGIDAALLPAFDFVDYFYPQLADHPDLHERLAALVERFGYRHERIIHGDFNLGNIVHKDGVYTIIDWTNGQLGDPRYDMAWAAMLLRIYAGDRVGLGFRDAYLAHASYGVDEIQAYEAIAMIRWLLLNRLVGLAKDKATINRVNKLIAGNSELAGLAV